MLGHQHIVVYDLLGYIRSCEVPTLQGLQQLITVTPGKQFTDRSAGP